MKLSSGYRFSCVGLSRQANCRRAIAEEQSQKSDFWDAGIWTADIRT
jgi:hypothetical protein